MKCPGCHRLAQCIGRNTQNHLRQTGPVKTRLYKCVNPDCQRRFTTVERLENSNVKGQR
jgi:transcriptional regulator NrdR family protein